MPPIDGGSTIVSNALRVLADAIGSGVPVDKTYAIERMRTAGADIVTTEMVLFEWLRNCTHSHFRHMLRLIK